MNPTENNKIEMNKIENPTVIDVFCGAGGISYGFQQAGYSPLAGFDNNINAKITYRNNFPNAKFYGEDIRNIDPKIVMSNLKLKSEELD